MGCKRMWLARSTLNEGPTNRHRGVPVPAHTQTCRSFVDHQGRTDRMWWCPHGGFDQWGSTLLLGWRWMRTAWTPGYKQYAKGRRWLSLSAKAQIDRSSSLNGGQGSILRQSSHSRCTQPRSPLFLGCRCLRPARASRHKQFPSWWRWLPLPTHSKMCHCKSNINQLLLIAIL